MQNEMMANILAVGSKKETTKSSFVFGSLGVCRSTFAHARWRGVEAVGKLHTIDEAKKKMRMLNNSFISTALSLSLLWAFAP